MPYSEILDHGEEAVQGALEQYTDILEGHYCRLADDQDEVVSRVANLFINGELGGATIHVLKAKYDGLKSEQDETAKKLNLLYDFFETETGSRVCPRPIDSDA